MGSSRGWRRRSAMRAAVAVLAIAALTATVAVFGPTPKAFAAAGEETAWIGPDTGGDWSDAANWTNGRPDNGTTVVFNTPVRVAPENKDIRGATLDFRAGSSGAVLSSTSEYRISGISLAEGVSVELGLRLLRIGQYSEIAVAMSDNSTLQLTRQVQAALVVESTKLVDGVGPQQADLENAVIRVGNAPWETSGIQLSGGVRLEMDKAVGTNYGPSPVEPFVAPRRSTAETASPTAGNIVWLRDEQLYTDSTLDLWGGLSIDLNGHDQTIGALSMNGATAALGDGGRLRIDSDQGPGTLVATGGGASVIAGGTLTLQGAAPIGVEVIEGSSLEVRSTLEGTGDLDVALGGGSLVLADACGYTGTIRLDGPGTVMAANGFGGVVKVGTDVEFIDGSLGECVSATVPPDPPREVTATPLDDAIGALIEWQMPFSIGTNWLERYEVYRSTDPVALGEKIADVLPPFYNVIEYVDEWSEDDYLEGWTTYYYRIRAVSATSISEPSAQVSVVTLGKPAAPATVTVLNGSGKVKLSWSRSTSTNVQGYRVYRSAAYRAPTEDDLWAGTEAPEWSAPFGADGDWERIAEVGSYQLDYLDDPRTSATRDVADTVDAPAFPLERTWNYYVTAYSHTFGEGEPYAVVAGTPSSRVELAMNIAQEVDAYPGTTAVFVADVSNLGESPTSADITARLLVPSAFPVRVVDPATGDWVLVASDTEADGDGDGVADWTCSAASIGESTMLRCAYAGSIPGMSLSVPLPFALDIPATAALGTVPISTAVSGTNATGAVGSGTSKPFVFDVEAIQRAALEATTTFDGALSPDPAHPALVSIGVRNSGTAATREPPTVTIDVPADTRLGTGYRSEAWWCSQTGTGADIRCVGDAAYFLGGILMPGAASPELVVPLLTPETPWYAGGGEALPFGITVVAADAYGTVSTQTHITAAPRIAEAPALQVRIESQDPAALEAGASAFRVAVTNAGGVSRAAPVTLSLRLPAGITIDQSLVPSGWACPQTGTTVECVSTVSHELARGQVLGGPLLRTGAMDESLAAAGQWQLTAHAAQDGIVGTPVSGVVEIAPLPAPAVASLKVQPEQSPLIGGATGAVTVTLAGDPTAGPAAARSFAVLLPSVVDATSANVSLSGFGATTPGAWGDCRVIDASEGPFPGAGDAVVCITATPVPQGAAAAIEVAFTTDRRIEGTLDFTAGFLDATGQAAAVDALRAAGASALRSPSVAAVPGIAFIVDAGPPQSVAASVIATGPTGEPEVLPTTVQLAGAVTGDLGVPVAYCWVQTGGPPVTWVEPAVGAASVTPGADGLPAFPASAEVPDGCEPGGFTAGSDHWFGPGASFLAPQTRDGAEIALRLYATDGTVVADAATTVMIEPAGNAMPVIEDISVLRFDGSAWVPLADRAAPQLAGTKLRLRVAVSDADGDRVSVTPWLISPRSAGISFALAPESTGAVQLLDFVWPTMVGQLDLGVTAADGHTTREGIATTASESLTLGPSPVPTIAPWTPITPDFEPITETLRIADGLNLKGWSANGPLDPATGEFALGTEIMHADEDAAWRPGPLELTSMRLRAESWAPAWCTAAAASSGEPILRFTATADIDWDGRDTKDSDFRFPVDGCIVPGIGWNIANAGAIKRLDISDVPGTLTFREVSFLAKDEHVVVLDDDGAVVRDDDGEIEYEHVERYEFLGTAQSNGADGPARLHVWVPGEDDYGYGATRFAVSLATQMKDLSLYYGGEGYLIYSPTALPSVDVIPGLDFDRGSYNPHDVCEGTTKHHGNIPIPAGFSALTNYYVDSLFCATMVELGLDMAGSMPMVTPISAIPKGTIYLSGGEYELFDDGDSGLAATMTGMRLVFMPNMLQLISDGTLTLPDLIDVFSGGRAGTPGGTSTVDVSIGLTFGTNFVKEHTLQLFIQKSGGPWNDAFAIPGFDLGELIVQGGFTWVRNVRKHGPYKKFLDTAFRAEVLGLPGILTDALGIVGNEPMVMSTRFSEQTPIYDLQLGIADGNTFMKPLRVISDGSILQEALTIDGAHLIFAPFGGSIGDHIYPWGMTLDFAMHILGLKVEVDANVDLWAAHMEADVDVGTWTAAGITMSQMEMKFVLDGFQPLATWEFTAPQLSGGTWATDLVLGIEAGVESAASDLEDAGRMAFSASSTTDSPYLRLDFAAAVRDLDLGGVAQLREVELWSQRELPLSTDLGIPLASLDMGLRASIGVLGHDIAVIGAVDIDTHGLHAFDLVGASEPLHVAGTAITGAGCGDLSAILPPELAVPNFPTNGPCVRVAVHPGAQDPVVVGLTGTIGVPSVGLEASFDGRLDGTGLAISLAKVQLTNAITAKLTDARFYFGQAVAAGQVTDTNAFGQTVTVRNGDFRLRGEANGNLLGGFGAKLDVDLGKIGTAAWANATAKLALFDDPKSPVRSSVRLAGSFAKSGGHYTWELEGRGSVAISGFQSTAMNFSAGENGSGHWFTLDGEIKAGPVTAGLSGDLSWNDGLNFHLAGTASMRMFGATAASANLTLSYVTTTKLVAQSGPGSAVIRDKQSVFRADLDFGGSIVGLIRLSGGGTILSNGDFCVNGSGKIFSVRSQATICHQGGTWTGSVAAEPWRDMWVAATLTSMTSFRAVGKIALPTVKKNVNLTYKGFGLSGDFVIRDMWLTLGVASDPGSVCIAFDKKGKCKESVTFTQPGLYVAGSASFKVHGCIKAGGAGSTCDHWSTGVSFKANPVKFCGSKSFKLLSKRWTISGCYEPPAKLYAT